MNNSNIRVRFAPSPTGSLHVGGARTALYNYLYAKKHGGQFILRVEDTDLARSTEAALRTQLADLAWLGLHCDEGPDAVTLEDKGDFGPYRQSARLEVYREHVHQLLEKGLAYYCFMTDEEIDQEKQKVVAAGRTYHVHSPYRDIPLTEAQQRLAAGDNATIRFKTPSTVKHYTINDLVRGRVTFPSDMVGDFVIMRANGIPVYNFACVVDDALMEISHVLRAEEHLSNSLRQLMLYEALNYTPPKFGHVSIILGDNKKKLSKREGAVSCDNYRQAGYLPEALLNYVAMLGWTDESGADIFNLEQLTHAFSLERLNASAAIFDRAKLKWVNSQHLKKLSATTLWQAVLPFLKEAGLKPSTDAIWQQHFIELFGPNLETLTDAVDYYRLLEDEFFVIDAEAKEVLQWEASPAVIKQWQAILQAHNNEAFTHEDFKNASKTIQQAVNVKGKQLFMPLRIAMIGQPHGAELRLLVELLTLTQLRQRTEKCLNNHSA